MIWDRGFGTGFFVENKKEDHPNYGHICTLFNRKGLMKNICPNLHDNYMDENRWLIALIGNVSWAS